MTELAAQPLYPVRLEIDYPERQSRWKALLRLPLSIPILIFATLLQSGVALAIWAAILVRGRIPHWLFDFQVALNRWQLRAYAYLLLLTDGYPPFEGAYEIRYEVSYPERLSRWRLVIWKFITSIPHLFVLTVLALTLVVVIPIGWFAILITGRFPQGLHGYVAGIFRWGARVNAYILSLTDEFPPFSLSPDAGSGGRRSYIISSAVGLLATTAVVGLVVTFLVILVVGSQRIVTEVSYERLLAGQTGPGEGIAEVHSGRVRLRAAVDPADEQYAFLAAQPGYRLVEFRFQILNWRGAGEEIPIRASRFSLRDTNDEEHDSILATVNRTEIAPADIASGELATVSVLFALPSGVDPVELQYDVLDYIGGSGTRLGEKIIYQFR